MSEEMIVKDPAREEDHNESSTVQQKSEVTRRNFLNTPSQRRRD